MKEAKMEAAMDGNACFGKPKKAVMAVFAAFALAASTVFGATYNWTGYVGASSSEYDENNYEWSSKKNWSPNGLPTGSDSTSHNADIRNSYFASGAERLITFSAARKMYWKTHLRNAGSESDPVVFRATADNYGLNAGVNTKSTGVRGWFIAFNEEGDETNVGPAWLKLERGTYGTGGSYGHWYIGSGTYEGHVTAESGVTMSASAGIELCNGSLELNGATATSGGVVIIGGRGTGSDSWNKSFAGVNARFVMNGGTASSVANTEIGCFSGSEAGEALLSLSGGATYKCTSNLQMGAGTGGNEADEMKLEIAGAKTTMSVAKNSDGKHGNIFINGGSGHIKIGAGGLLDVAGTAGVCIADGGRGYANVGGNFEIVLGGGGTLATHCITNNNSSAPQQVTIKFEGGTLKAKSGRDCFVHGANQLAAVKVGEAGGTIDTSGFNVGIQKALSSGTESGTADGGMKFIGGGTATLDAAPSYTGPTVLENGSILKVPDAASMVNILSQGFTVDLTGVTTAYDGMKVLDSGAGNAIDASSLANAQAVSNGAEDADYELGVSSDGGAVVLFSKNSSVWTGGGEDNKMSNPANWRNNRVPAAGGQVDFANAPAETEVDADIEGDPVFSLVTFGDNVVTFTGKLTADDFSDTTKISVGANATVTLKKGIRLTGTGDEYILHSIAQGGTFKVKGDIEAAGSGNQMVYGLVAPVENGGYIHVEGNLLCHSDSSDRHPFRLGGAQTVKWIVQKWINDYGTAQGKSFFFVDKNHKAEIEAGQDMLILARIGVLGELTLNTTTPEGDPAVISIDGGSLTREGTVYVKGSGAVQCKYKESDMQSNSARTTNFVVGDGATLSFPNGASTYIGTGTKTVESGCTMSVPVSASVALKGTLVLKDDAILAFHFTEKGVAPAIVDTTTKIDAGAKVYIAMSSDRTAYATVDKYVLLSGLAAGTEASSFAFAPGSQPAWARSLSVETVDNKLCLVLETRKPGTFITLR